MYHIFPDTLISIVNSIILITYTVSSLSSLQRQEIALESSYGNIWSHINMNKLFSPCVAMKNPDFPYPCE